MDASEIRKQRDREMRYGILQYVAELRKTNWLGFVPAAEAYKFLAKEKPGAFDGEGYFIGLARDLVAKGMLEEKLGTVRIGERLGVRHLSLRITDKGLMLYREEIPPDPDIDDSRLTLE